MEAENLLWEEPDWTGHLDKFESSSKTWERLFFVLRGSFLFFFSNELDRRVPVGLIALDGSRICEASGQGSRKFSFAIKAGAHYAGLGKHDEYTLSTTTSESLKQVMATLEDAASPPDDLSGYLCKTWDREAELRSLLAKSPNDKKLVAGAQGLEAQALKTELVKSYVEMEALLKQVEEEELSADTKEKSLLKATALWDILRTKGSGKSVPGYSPSARLQHELQTTKALCQALQKKANFLQGQGLEDLTEEARRLLQRMIRLASEVIHERHSKVHAEAPRYSFRVDAKMYNRGSKGSIAKKTPLRAAAAAAAAGPARTVSSPSNPGALQSSPASQRSSLSPTVSRFHSPPDRPSSSKVDVPAPSSSWLSRLRRSILPSRAPSKHPPSASTSNFQATPARVPSFQVRPAEPPSQPAPQNLSPPATLRYVPKAFSPLAAVSPVQMAAALRGKRPGQPPTLSDQLPTDPKGGSPTRGQSNGKPRVSFSTPAPLRSSSPVQATTKYFPPASKFPATVEALKASSATPDSFRPSTPQFLSAALNSSPVSPKASLLSSQLPNESSLRPSTPQIPSAALNSSPLSPPLSRQLPQQSSFRPSTPQIPSAALNSSPKASPLPQESSFRPSTPHVPSAGPQSSPTKTSALSTQSGSPSSKSTSAPVVAGALGRSVPSASPASNLQAHPSVQQTRPVSRISPTVPTTEQPTQPSADILPTKFRSPSPTAVPGSPQATFRVHPSIQSRATSPQSQTSPSIHPPFKPPPQRSASPQASQGFQSSPRLSFSSDAAVRAQAFPSIRPAFEATAERSPGAISNQGSSPRPAAQTSPTMMVRQPSPTALQMSPRAVHSASAVSPSPGRPTAPIVASVPQSQSIWGAHQAVGLPSPASLVRPPVAVSSPGLKLTSSPRTSPTASTAWAPPSPSTSRGSSPTKASSAQVPLSPATGHPVVAVRRTSSPPKPPLPPARVSPPSKPQLSSSQIPPSETTTPPDSAPPGPRDRPKSPRSSPVAATLSNSQDGPGQSPQLANCPPFPSASAGPPAPHHPVETSTAPPIEETSSLGPTSEAIRPHTSMKPLAAPTSDVVEETVRRIIEESMPSAGAGPTTTTAPAEFLQVSVPSRTDSPAQSVPLAVTRGPRPQTGEASDAPASEGAPQLSDIVEQKLTVRPPETASLDPYGSVPRLLPLQQASHSAAVQQTPPEILQGKTFLPPAAAPEEPDAQPSRLEAPLALWQPETVSKSDDAAASSKRDVSQLCVNQKMLLDIVTVASINLLKHVFGQAELYIQQNQDLASHAKVAEIPAEGQLFISGEPGTCRHEDDDEREADPEWQTGKHEQATQTIDEVEVFKHAESQTQPDHRQPAAEAHSLAAPAKVHQPELPPTQAHDQARDHRDIAVHHSEVSSHGQDTSRDYAAKERQGHQLDPQTHGQAQAHQSHHPSEAVHPPNDSPPPVAVSAPPVRHSEAVQDRIRHPAQVYLEAADQAQEEPALDQIGSNHSVGRHLEAAGETPKRLAVPFRRTAAQLDHSQSSGQLREAADQSATRSPVQAARLQTPPVLKSRNPPKLTAPKSRRAAEASRRDVSAPGYLLGARPQLRAAQRPVIRGYEDVRSDIDLILELDGPDGSSRACDYQQHPTVASLSPVSSRHASASSTDSEDGSDDGEGGDGTISIDLTCTYEFNFAS